MVLKLPADRTDHCYQVGPHYQLVLTVRWIQGSLQVLQVQRSRLHPGFRSFRLPQQALLVPETLQYPGYQLVLPVRRVLEVLPVLKVLVPHWDLLVLRVRLLPDFRSDLVRLMIQVVL